ncbi:MAG TPA: prepilin-type N-terminal cleavage/methylation domain-containing protein [Candidatus Saccharimonadales bacterium]|nr:prepilin-type N-terminal cleavage/methylation domain-containing protein [Candidatus Saccharimonadales bacterium]
MKIPHKSSGFTIIELLVVLIVLFILASLIAFTYSGVQAKNRNAERKADIDTIKGQLEAYYAQTNTYPTFANLASNNWRSTNLKRLKDDAIQDPSWKIANTACKEKDQASFAVKATNECYSYQVTGTDGSACDNKKNPCAHYTLVAMLEGGEKYTRSSLN